MTKPKYPPKLGTNTYRLETEEQNGVTYPTLVAWRRKPSSDDIARFCRENPGVVVRSTPLDKTAHVYQCRMVEKEGDTWVALGTPVSVPVPSAREAFTQADAASLLAQHVEGLNALLVRVRASFPFRDACYYLANDTLHLLTGASHDGTGVSRPERSMANARLNHASGGDW